MPGEAAATSPPEQLEKPSQRPFMANATVRQTMLRNNVTNQ
jgi:hypothetical protein